MKSCSIIGHIFKDKHKVAGDINSLNLLVDFGFILVAMWAALEYKQMGEQPKKVVTVGKMVKWCYYICIEIFVCC